MPNPLDLSLRITWYVNVVYMYLTILMIIWIEFYIFLSMCALKTCPYIYNIYKYIYIIYDTCNEWTQFRGIYFLPVRGQKPRRTKAPWFCKGGQKHRLLFFRGGQKPRCFSIDEVGSFLGIPPPISFHVFVFLRIQHFVVVILVNLIMTCIAIWGWGGVEFCGWVFYNHSHDFIL